MNWKTRLIFLPVLLLFSACVSQLNTRCVKLNDLSASPEVFELMKDSFRNSFGVSDAENYFEEFLSQHTQSILQCGNVVKIEFFPNADDLGDPSTGPVYRYEVDADRLTILNESIS